MKKSALSIPHEPRPVEVAVADHWVDLEQIDDLEELKALTNSIGKMPLGAWLTDSRYTAEELWDAFTKQRDGTDELDPGPEALLAPEWTALTVPGGADHGVDFAVVDAGQPDTDRYREKLGGLHLATRLREVVALTGFTRIDAHDPADVSPTAVKRAPLSANRTSWAPAAQSRGEGVLVTLNEEALSAWEKSLESTSEGRHLDMYDAQVAWRERRDLPTAGEYASSRFVLVHTLSHLLIKAVSLLSGYATASIRERIYCRASGRGDFPMAGVLLYTAAADSEGTLGGLVSIGQPGVMGPLIDEALDNARICSSDPFCAAHKPNGSIESHPESLGDGTLHGSACHVCLFLPETSCDHGNRYLDRAFAVPTLTDSRIAFFS